MLRTEWEIRTYDVWGNAEDGYEVNASYVTKRHHEMLIPVTTYNRGTPLQFSSASPTDRQIKEALDLDPDITIETGGDDVIIYVTLAHNAYPAGELYCTSHVSLSPIRET